MAYLFLNQDHLDDNVVTAMQEREREWANYELNRQNYEAMLAAPDVAALPDVWPDELMKYKQIVGEKLASMSLTAEDYATVTALQFRDRIRLLLATTKTEQAKCMAVYNSLLSQIPNETRMNAAITRAKAQS